MGLNVKYRNYDTGLNATDVETLLDVDEYYQDVVQTLSTLQNPTIFITCWLLIPSIRVTENLSFEDLLVRELSKANSRIYLLWNTNYNGTPFPQLASLSRKLHGDVTRRAGATPERFKIILSTNLQFESLRFYLVEDVVYDLTDKLAEKAQTAWLAAFPKDRDSYKNLNVFTLGSHHQKTVTVIGTDNIGKSVLRAYCGGIDFSPGPAGLNAGVCYGGTWWHDTAIRVKGMNARGVLENFVERWNADMSTVVAGNTLSYGVANTDTIDIDATLNGVDTNTTASGKVNTVRTMPVAGTDWPGGLTRSQEILKAYEDWIDEAEEHLVVVNQYFRSRGIASDLLAQLDDEEQLRVTIVMPAYSEEIGKRIDLGKLRQKYADRGTTPAERTALLTTIKDKALTIDPFNKLTVWLQSNCLKDLIDHPRVRIWIPKAPKNIPYIHAKMLLVDTRMLMIGSANLNGRSLSGLADSEINLLLQEPNEVQRLCNKHKWHIEPEDESAGNYAGTWYQKHNLVRYTKQHWEVDKEYGTFPKGKANLVAYAERMKTDGRLDMLKLKFSKAELEAAFDQLAAAGFDLDNGDLGEFVIVYGEHLL